jgi:chitodextrinase
MRPLVRGVLKSFALGVLGGVFVMVADAATTTYTYDVHGRLTVVALPSGTDQSVTTYTLDNAGNRTSVAVALVDTTPPNAPTALTATALASDKIRLNWTASQDVGGGAVWFYRVYRADKTGVWATPTAPPFDDANLLPNTSYTYRVSAVDLSSNESSQTAPASATTPNGPDVIPPSVPTNLAGNGTLGTTVSLSWTASTDTGGAGMAGYEVFRNGSSIGTTATATYSDTGRTPATTYYYKIRAYDAASPANYSGFTAEIPVTTRDTIPPSAPGAVTFSSITGGTARADWVPATDNVGVVEYQYRLSTNGGATWSSWTGGLSTNGVTLYGLSAATTYWLQVEADDAARNWAATHGDDSFTTSSVYTDNLQFTVGSNGGGTGGYLQGSFGAMSPNTLSYGKTVTQYTSTAVVSCPTPVTCTVNWASYFVVSGFSANPGSTWLQPGGSVNGATAVFSYSGGVATWYWPAQMVPGSGTVTLTIIHP